MSRLSSVRRVAVSIIVSCSVAAAVALAHPAPAAAMTIGQCGSLHAYIGVSGQDVIQNTSFNCTIDVPVITLQSCLNYQIFLWIWSGDQYCRADSDENRNFAYVYAIDYPPHGRTYRIHARAQIVPPAGVRCDAYCTTETWTNGVHYQ